MPARVSPGAEAPKGFRRPFNVPVVTRSFLKYRLRVWQPGPSRLRSISAEVWRPGSRCPGLCVDLPLRLAQRLVLVLVLVESSSTLGSEYYKTGALQQWTLVQSEKEYPKAQQPSAPPPTPNR